MTSNVYFHIATFRNIDNRIPGGDGEGGIFPLTFSMLISIVILSLSTQETSETGQAGPAS